MEKTLSGKETLQSIIDLVDIEKVKLPSYTISMKKFDTIADAYTKITYLLCMVNVAKENSEEVKNTAIKFINRVNKNPQYYCYSNMNSLEKDNIEEATASFFPSYIGDVRIEHLKRSFRNKNLKEALHFLLENLYTYKEKLPEDLIERALCTNYVEESIMHFQNSFKKTETKNNVNEKSKQDIISPETAVKKTFWQKLFKK